MRPRSKLLERDRRTDRSKQTEGASNSIGTREFENKDETARKRLENSELHSKKHTAQKRLDILRRKSNPLEKTRKTDRSKETRGFENEGRAAQKRLYRGFENKEQTARKRLETLKKQAARNRLEVLKTRSHLLERD